MRMLTAIALGALALSFQLGAPTPVLAHDHIVNAVQALGRSPLNNPGQPVSKSGGAANPANAPGGGDPKVSRPGNEEAGLGTPSSLRGQANQAQKQN